MELNALLDNKTNHPEVDQLLARIAKDYKERLWSDLGLKTLDLLYAHRNFNAQNIIRAVHRELTTNVDPFVHLELLDLYLGRDSSGLDAKLKVIEEFKPFVEKNESAKVYLALLTAKHLLLEGDVEQAVARLEEAEREMAKLRNYPKLLHSALNYTRMAYHWRKADMPNFVKSAHQYLAYTDKRKFSPEEQLDISTRVVAASLVSDSVLNFGDILDNEFFRCLQSERGQPALWALVGIFNRGKVEEFQRFMAANAAKLESAPLLAANLAQLDRKIRVIALYDAIFFAENSFSKQHISFREIADIAKVELIDVERLLVHVLSIELIKGSIDEPAEVFVIQELKPRDLDKERLGQLKEKYRNWQGTVGQTLQFINSTA